MASRWVGTRPGSYVYPIVSEPLRPVSEDSSLALLRGADDESRAAVRSPIRTTLLLGYFATLVWWFGRAGVSLDKDVITIREIGGEAYVWLSRAREAP